MKILILALSFATSVSAFAAPSDCGGNLEAQLFAKVDSVIHVPAEAGGQTIYTIKDVSDVIPNSNCPLSEEFVSQAQIVIQGYSDVKEGMDASGTYIFNPKLNKFSIE